jgi:CRISPR-associated protein Csd1
MNWLHELYETYEANKSILGKVELNRWHKEVQLLPIAHAFQNAQIEVTITGSGDFHSAKVVEKEKAPTLIPVTIESAGRTSKPTPHPLHDSLQYVAGDYEKYGGTYKSENSYEMYIRNLEAWCIEGNAPKDIQSICEYLKKRCLINDLLSEGVLHTEEDGVLISKWKKEMGEKPAVFKVLVGDQFSTFVRFTIRDSEAIWKNQKIVNNYIEFLESKLENEALDYVTGKSLPKAESHPSKIRYGGDMAKLISGNDSSNFTYRGRFLDKEQVATVSYEVSQKAHNALKWLIDKQGRIIDGRTFLVWGKNHPAVPTPDESSEDLFDDDEGDNVVVVDTQKIFAQRFSKALFGYKEKLEVAGNITIMILDAATPGRMGILHYQNMHPNLYLKRIEKWHKMCWWEHRSKKGMWYGAPRLKEIAESAYGEEANLNVIKNTVTALYPCVLQGQEMPETLVQSIFYRTCSPASFKEDWQWRKQLNIACAVMYHKFRYHEEGSEETVAVNENRTDRSYLFGRLLAVADVLEGRAMKDSSESRATNAARYMNAFSMRPVSTWMTVRLAINPYQQKLKQKRQNDGQREIDDILAKFEEGDFSDKALNGQFLLGYSSQRNKMFNSSKKDSDDGGENNDNTSE